LARDVFKELGFPYQANEAGVCEKLGADNKCTVYENRPEICRTDKVYEKYFADRMTKFEYYKLNAEGCNKFMQEDGVDKNLLLDIDSVSGPARSESPGSQILFR
jgi:hypothetical protein